MRQKRLHSKMVATNILWWTKLCKIVELEINLQSVVVSKLASQPMLPQCYLGQGLQDYAVW